METRDICKFHELCGGCLYQGVDYENQLAQKDKEIRRMLAKHKINEGIYQGMVPAFSCYGYRNKMEYTFGDFEIGGELELGMHRKRSFMSVLSTDECQIVPDQFNQVLRTTLDFCREKGYSYFHRKKHAGLLRNLVVRCGVRTNELLINIVTTTEEGFDEEGYKDMLLSQDWGEMTIVGIIRTFNDSVADAVIDEGTKILYGRDYYNEKILGLKFKVKAFAFFQTNIPAVERLYSDALEMIPNIDNKTVYDLYCGTGTISQLMASRAREVYGVEIVEDAVIAARANTELNGITNCHYICGDVKEKLSELTEKPDVIVVDPPRVGMHDQVVIDLCKYAIPEFLYISCNPNTLCMNLEKFRENGYEATYLKVYDNFPMTKHAECICRLKRLPQYDELIAKVDSLLAGKRPIIAVCGNASAGLAAFLKNHYDCNLYNWAGPYLSNSSVWGQSSDLENDILIPTKRGKTVRYPVYSSIGTFRKYKIKDPTQLTVVEGEGFMDESLLKYYDCIIDANDDRFEIR
ncbi:MAG: 23S rRNA (uracil(1939)-C(5))-methyltransferase RlmD [Clostridiales bacterium]|nr:23S rRNA (uracil(1939)-C(5))-methyltransferase RlmD [Candidatus Crickella equi]